MGSKFAWSRRTFLGALGAITGGLIAPAESGAMPAPSKKHKAPGHSGDGHPIVPITSGLGSTGDIYAELGVTPLVNINGTVTVIGGAGVHPGGIELIRPGDEQFVFVDGQEKAAGEVIPANM